MCYRGHVFPNGKVCLKTCKDAIHVRDVEEYYRQYIERLRTSVNDKHMQRATSDRLSGVASLDAARRARKRRLHFNGNGKRSKGDVEQAALVYDRSDVDTCWDAEYVSEEDMGKAGIESFLYDDSHVHRLVESAMYGDSLALHVLLSDVACASVESEPQTYKQAMKLPDRKAWKKP